MDPALGKAADLGAEGGCAETKFFGVSNLPTYPYHLASDTPVTGMTQEAEEGWIPPLARLLTLVGRAARWPRRSGALESCALESRMTVDRRARAAAPTSVSIHSCETGEQGSTSASATEDDCLGGEVQVLVMLPC